MHYFMNFRLCVLLALYALLAASAAPTAREDLRLRFEALDDERNFAGVVQLWKEHPSQTLGVIDSYLEGSLARLERDPSVDPKSLASLHARARRGAVAADQAFATCVFVEYAVAFAAWSADEQKQFRQGQALFRAASKSLSAGALQAGLGEARQSLELARPLGDWWGSAMALNAMARAEVALGEYAHSLEHAAEARRIDHELRLLDAEYDDLFLAASAADGWERHPRALAYAQAGLELALQFGKQDMQVKSLGQILRAQEKLGDTAGAGRTRAELAALTKTGAEPGGK